MNTLQTIFTLALSLYGFFSSFSISLQQIFFASAIVVFLIAISKKNTWPRLRWRTYYVIFLIWMSWRLIHVVISPQPWKELYEFREMWLFLMFILIADGLIPLSFLNGKEKSFLWGKSPLEILVLAMLAGATFVSLFNLGVMLERKDNLFLTDFRARGLGEQNALTFSGAVSFALVLGGALIYKMRLAFKAKGVKSKVYFLVVLILFLGTVLAFILAKARGGYLAFFLTILAMAFFLRPKQALIVYSAVLLFSLGLLFLFPGMRGYFAKALPRPGQHENTMEQRRDLWLAGIAMIREKPFVGWGDAGFYENYHRFRVEGAHGVAKHGSHMHNDMLNTWVFYGIPGLVLYLLFFAHPLYEFLKIKNRAHPEYPFLYASFFAIVFLFFQGLSQCHFSDDEVVTLFWLNTGAFYALKERICGELPAQ
ncbi:MAG: O-antigen ligase family protein [Leptospiraceae bacterium]|nr:O-antigen ligase family protein [Leptospiraceae bacterium]MDW8306473.1 O-antigen ligase family protein [Leptospiraceae bacterium]